MKRKPKQQKHSTTKSITYAILVGTALIMLWRGVWGLLDIYFFPQNKPVSFAFSVVIGLAILYITGKLIEELI